MNHPAIRVQHLVKCYGNQRAVDGVSFTVAPGEVYGLLGPNGAGKTTTVECIEGLRKPDSGLIEVLGMSHETQSRAIKARLGVQLQSAGLFPRLTVRETIDLYASFFPRTLPTDQVLRLMGLTDLQKADPATLSGGWRQRLTLASALVNDPDLIFLDEPTTGMDPAARRDVWDLIRGLKALGKTIVLTTHYMEEAAQLCDRVAVIDHGRLLAEGRPDDLVRQAFPETAVEFTTPAGVEPACLRELPGVIRLVAEAGTCTLYSIRIPDTVAGLLQLSREASFPLERFTVRQPTLEDLFLRLTGRRLHP
ncbi:MAG TPA: ABC transporter ATP-binding protein [Symbiobacteriaceae bacterium]